MLPSTAACRDAEPGSEDERADEDSDQEVEIDDYKAAGTCCSLLVQPLSAKALLTPRAAELYGASGNDLARLAYRELSEKESRAMGR